jgi:hypothetical protein
MPSLWTMLVYSKVAMPNAAKEALKHQLISQLSF